MASWMLTGLGLLALAALYLGRLHLMAMRERGRRRSGRVRLAVWIGAAGGDPARLADEAQRLRQSGWNLLWDRPRALPFLAAVLLGGALAVPLLDPVLDDPLLLPALAPPGWVRRVWAGLVLLAVLGHALWVFFAAPGWSSRHWLVLDPGGRIGTEPEGLLPPLDLRDPGLESAEGVVGTGGHRHPGRVLRGRGATVAFLYAPEGSTAPGAPPLPLLPADWYRVEIAQGSGWLERLAQGPAGVR